MCEIDPLFHNTYLLDDNARERLRSANRLESIGLRDDEDCVM